MGVIFNRLRVQPYAPPLQKNPAGPQGPAPETITAQFSTGTVPHDEWEAPVVRKGYNIRARARGVGPMGPSISSAPVIERSFSAAQSGRWAPNDCWSEVTS